MAPLAMWRNREEIRLISWIYAAEVKSKIIEKEFFFFLLAKASHVPFLEYPLSAANNFFGVHVIDACNIYIELPWERGRCDCEWVACKVCAWEKKQSEKEWAAKKNKAMQNMFCFSFVKVICPKMGLLWSCMLFFFSSSSVENLNWMYWGFG